MSLKHDSPRKLRDSDESLTDFLQVEAQIKNDNKGMGLTFFPIERQKPKKEDEPKQTEKTINNFSKIISYIRTKINAGTELHAIKLRMSQFKHNHMCVLIDKDSTNFKGIYVLNELEQKLTRIWGENIPETIDPSMVQANYIFYNEKKDIEEFKQDNFTQKTEIVAI